MKPAKLSRKMARIAALKERIRHNKFKLKLLKEALYQKDRIGVYEKRNLFMAHEIKQLQREIQDFI